jgi:sterol desaturase/sphingolipid hydroxylase (fatty acid hydroxylase superfamily)
MLDSLEQEYRISLLFDHDLATSNGEVDPKTTLSLTFDPKRLSNRRRICVEEGEMGYLLAVLLLGLGMLAVERRHPGRSFERVDGWHGRALLPTAIQAAVGILSTLAWDRWFFNVSPWRWGGHGIVLDGVLGYFVITFIYYWWHRARHEIPVLWQWLHQVHHSACSIEVLTSFYKHPVELLINGVLTSAILYLVLGLDAASASVSILLAGIAELFYHWNIRTPHWLGYLIQRPESHCIHHLRGWHRSNYSDLPLWDILFGTFENPRTQPVPCGFGADAEKRFFTMLIGRSVADDTVPGRRESPSETRR